MSRVSRDRTQHPGGRDGERGAVVFGAGESLSIRRDVVAGLLLLAALATAAWGLVAAPAAEARKVTLGVAMPRLTTVLNVVHPTSDVLRTSLTWRSVQPGCRAIRRSQFNWQKADRDMQRALRPGVQRLVTLRGVPGCAAARNNTRFEPKPGYVNDFGRFARRVVERYGPGGTAFRRADFRGRCCPLTDIEVWSEPSLTSKWSRPDGDAYGRFLKKVARRVRDARNWRDRRMDVVSAGMSAKRRSSFFHQLMGVPRIGRAIDVVGLHTYAPSPKIAIKGVRKARRIMRKHGRRVPIAITEHGWSTCPRPGVHDSGKCVPRATQARYLKRYVTALRARRNGGLNVESFMWFAPQDTATRRSVSRCPSSPKNFYGFFDHWGRAKPSWFTWQALTGVNAADRAKPLRRLDGCK